MPKVKKEKTNKSPFAKKKKSLFAQQFHQYDKKIDLGQENVSDDVQMNPADDQADMIENNGSKADYLMCQRSSEETPEKSGIDAENKEKLHNMTESQILEEQEKLLKSLGKNRTFFTNLNTG